MDPDETRLTRSYMDSLTNVTRASLNVPNEGSSFEDEDGPNGASMVDNPYNHSSPLRTKPSGEHGRRAQRRRLLPGAALLAEDEMLARPDIRRSDQLTPDYPDVGRTKDYGNLMQPGRCLFLRLFQTKLCRSFVHICFGIKPIMSTYFRWP